MSGLPREAAFHEAGTPSSLAMVSSDIARTSDDTPIMVNIKNEAQAKMRAIEQI